MVFKVGDEIPNREALQELPVGAVVKIVDGDGLVDAAVKVGDDAWEISSYFQQQQDAGVFWGNPRVYLLDVPLAA